MKKYVETSEENISQSNIHKAAVEIIRNELEDLKYFWSDYDINFGGWDALNSIYIPDSEEPITYDQVLKDHPDLYRSLKDEINSVINNTMNSIK